MRPVVLVVGLLLAGVVGRAQDGPAVICSLDPPLLASGETATAKVLADVPDRSAVHYEWSATGGGFAENLAAGSTVGWIAPSGGQRSYELTVVARRGEQVIGSCKVSVTVEATVRSSPSAPSQGFQTEGSILLQGVSERPGYGLYSYLLLASPPEGDGAARVHALLQTYLDEILAVKGLEGYFKSSQLNVTYLPLQQAMEEQLTVDSVLDHYDYARAKLLLSKIPGSHTTGSYILSSLSPLTAAASVQGSYLLEDLSAVPASAIPFWVQQFLSQTAQQRFWEAKTLDGVALRLRTAIAIAAEGLPDVRKAVTSWIVFSPGH